MVRVEEVTDMLAGAPQRVRWGQHPWRPRVSRLAVGSMALPFVSLLFLPPIGAARAVPEVVLTATARLIVLLPVAAIVLGIAALVQIHGSGGTRWGRLLAVAGIVSGIGVEVYIASLMMAALGGLLCGLFCV
jgi:hypothetical protein